LATKAAIPINHLHDVWFGGVILKRAQSPPRITARRGGRAIKKVSRSHRFGEAGVMFRSTAEGTPPRGVNEEASRLFPSDVTSPRRDARRGLRFP
jgi:hypothetical protein